MFLISNTLEHLELKLEKIIGIWKHAGKVKELTFGLAIQLPPQNGKMTYMRKKGSQQTIKVVTMTAIVLAAFLSFDNDIFAFSLMNLCMSVLVWFE